MLSELGITRLAYDWRAEHVKQFEAEILACQKHGIEFFAFWGEHPAAFALFEKHRVKPQIWKTLREPKSATTQAEKVEVAAQALLPLARRCARFGGKLGLYNHGGWGGDPTNLVAVCQRLHALDMTHVGIVYNWHHGHDQIDRWSESLRRMQPWLLCLNLNGMNRNASPKILAMGQGAHERGMLQAVLDSGYDGPIGILDHQSRRDARDVLRENLNGLRDIKIRLKSKPPDWHCPARADSTPPSFGLLTEDGMLPRMRYDVDVHIEDGFARTTIDQTFFNRSHRQREGIYRITLPEDAATTRVAMYANGKRMEAGIVERKRGRAVYDQIRNAHRDPVLLEWEDGRTFSMRVFPIEGRSHKRILISYTQALETDERHSFYRFRTTASHSRAFSATLRLHHPAHPHESIPPDCKPTPCGQGGRTYRWSWESNTMRQLPQPGFEIRLGPAPDHSLRHATDEGDFILLRHTLPTRISDSPRAEHWAVIFEASADRDVFELRQQLKRLETFLKGTPRPVPVIVANTAPHVLRGTDDEVLDELENLHVIGGLDLGAAISAAVAEVIDQPHPAILHLGAGHISLGERRIDHLLGNIPTNICYLALSPDDCGSFMQKLPARPWSSRSRLNGPESLDEWVRSGNRPLLRELTLKSRGIPWRPVHRQLRYGDQLIAFAHLKPGMPLPETIVLGGRDHNDRKWEQRLSPEWTDQVADYVPRSWARQEIDALSRLNAEQHREQIIELSRKHQLMSPFTSLLVLETDSMHRDFKVAQGRKLHWAKYPAPDHMPEPPPPRFPAPASRLKFSDVPVTGDQNTLEYPEKGLKVFQPKLPKPLFLGFPIQIPDLPNLEGSGTPHACLESHRWRPTAAGRPITLERWRRNNGLDQNARFRAPANCKKLSLGAKVTSSEDFPVIGELHMLTDGDKDLSEGSYMELGPSRQWVQIDLEQPRELWAICLWHHGSYRVYHDVVVQISSDPTFQHRVETVFNNDHDNSSQLGVGGDPAYLETNLGRTIQLRGQQARYIRCYSRGNTINPMNHYIELEAWGLSAGNRNERKGDWKHVAELEQIVHHSWESRKHHPVDLQWLRLSHSMLLKEIHAATLAEGKFPDDLVPRVRKTADRWWGIDAGSPEACTLAAEILSRVGQHDLSWKYLTTPLAVRPDHSDLWDATRATVDRLHDEKLRQRILTEEKSRQND